MALNDMINTLRVAEEKKTGVINRIQQEMTKVVADLDLARAENKALSEQLVALKNTQSTSSTQTTTEREDAALRKRLDEVLMLITPRPFTKLLVAPLAESARKPKRQEPSPTPLCASGDQCARDQDDGELNNGGKAPAVGASLRKVEDSCSRCFR